MGYLNVSCLPPHERHIQIRYIIGKEFPKKSFVQFNMAQDEDFIAHLAALRPKKPPQLTKKLMRSTCSKSNIGRAWLSLNRDQKFAHFWLNTQDQSFRKNNNQTRRSLVRVCATRMYRSNEFPKFQTGIFIEWKARPGFCVFPIVIDNDHSRQAFQKADPLLIGEWFVFKLKACS